MHSNPGDQPFFAVSDGLCVLGILAGCFGGISIFYKFAHSRGSILIAVFVFLTLGVAGVMLWLRWMQATGRDLSLKWLFVTWCLFALLFAILFPLAHRHNTGAGSDRDDALRVSAAALVHGHYPYSVRTFLGNAITPLPGAILLATPFYLIGNVSLQNLLWLAILLWFCAAYFRQRSTAVVFVLLVLGATSCNLDDFVVGGDFVVNTIYVAIALYLVLVTHEREAAVTFQQIAAEVFLGLAIDSRPTYIVVFPLLAAYLWKHVGPKMAIRAVLVSGIVAGALSIPFYLYDPAHFGPLHVTHKLDFIPARFKATLVLPALGLLASCLGFFIKLSRPRMYFVLGVCMFFMVGVPSIWGWLDAGWSTLSGLYWLSTLSVPAFFFSLWILASYEERGLALRQVRPSESPAV